LYLICVWSQEDKIKKWKIFKIFFQGVKTRLFAIINPGAGDTVRRKGVHIVFYVRCCPATAKTRAKTFEAPACFNVFAHSFNVAPVVLMSSTRQIFLPAKLWPFRTAKASATLAALPAGLPHLNFIYDSGDVYRSSDTYCMKFILL